MTVSPQIDKPISQEMGNFQVFVPVKVRGVPTSYVDENENQSGSNTIHLPHIYSDGFCCFLLSPPLCQKQGINWSRPKQQRHTTTVSCHLSNSKLASLPKENNKLNKNKNKNNNNYNK